MTYNNYLVIYFTEKLFIENNNWGLGNKIATIFLRLSLFIKGICEISYKQY